MILLSKNFPNYYFYDRILQIKDITTTPCPSQDFIALIGSDIWINQNNKSKCLTGLFQYYRVENRKISHE